ncbi:MAG: hypothetical protein ACLQKA_13685 [Bryobacteraceae bacterium]
MSCQLREELTYQYLGVLDSVDRAKHRLRNAVTRTNIECASTDLRRVEEYRISALRQIAEHCESHRCGTLELEGICGLELVAHAVNSGEMVA